MKSIIIICVLVTIATALTPSLVNECTAPIIKFKSISLSNGDKINSETVMTVGFESSKTLASDDSAILTLDIATKPGWFIWIPIPTLIFSALARNLEYPPGIEHKGGNQFKIDCRASKRFMPVCPPAQGSNTINYDFTYIFKVLKEKEKLNSGLATALRWFASGDYRITAAVDMTAISSAPGEKMACFEAEVSLKL